MTTIDPAEFSKSKAQKRLIAAVALFLAWVTFLIVLGMLSATGPGRRTSTVEVKSAQP